MKYYIGVDGGGTKTAFALFDENKKMLETVTGPGSNHENLEDGFNAASDIIMNGLKDLCTKAGIELSKISFTLMGLAGIGDLIVTCTSMHSRNNRCGQLIGQGMSYEDASREIGMVVEGYHALEAAMELSKKYSVELPITEAVHKVIKDGLSPKEAMYALMTRDLKSELMD